MSGAREDVGQTIAAADAGKFLLFDPERVSALNGIRVFDVGQGDCIGLRDQDDRVFCYVDYGGLCDHPDKADPANTPQRLPVGSADDPATIVLTHWDKDHFWSATKNPAACDVPLRAAHASYLARPFRSSMPGRLPCASPSFACLYRP